MLVFVLGLVFDVTEEEIRGAAVVVVEEVVADVAVDRVLVVELDGEREGDEKEEEPVALDTALLGLVEVLFVLM